MNNIQSLYRVIPAKKKTFFWFILILVFGKSLFDLISLGSIIPLIYAIFDPVKLVENVNLDFLSLDFLSLEKFSELEIIYYSTIFIFIIFLVKNIYVIIFNYLMARFLRSIFVDLSNRAFSNSLKLFDGSSEKYNSNELTKIIFQELNGFTYKILNSFFIICTDVLFIILFLIFLVFQGNILIFLFVSPLLITGMVYYLILNKYVKRIGDKRLEYDTNRLKGLQESYALIKVIRVLNKIKNFEYYVDRFSFKSVDQGTKFTLISKFLIVIIEILVITILCYSIFYFSNNIDVFKTLLPVFILIFISSIKFIPMISRLTLAFQKLKFNEAATNRIYDLSNKEIQSNFSEKKEINFNNSIVFNNVSFYYEKEKQKKIIFKNLNFEIKKNQCYGIVGPSGSGKSTFLEIICGLLETSEGSIICDNKEFNQKKNKLKSSYVTQDTRILNTSLKKNITLNLKTVDDNFDEEKYYKSIKKSNLLNFVNQLKDKDETILGEFGSTISGGQKQRIGIARALYHDSSMLILDEFTSSLDEKTEKSVLEDIRGLKNDKTIILSTHKKNILSICDQVYRIDNLKLKKED